MMDKLTFLKTILPEDGYKFVGLSRAGGSGITHKAYVSLELMAEAIASYDEQTNLTIYHACAAYKEPSYEAVVNGETKKKYRGQPNLLKAKSLWCDIDCGETKAAEGKGYATKGEAVNAIRRFCAEKGLPDPMIVDSGGGIHCYWPLTKTVVVLIAPVLGLSCVNSNGLTLAPLVPLALSRSFGNQTEPLCLGCQPKPW